MLERSGNYEAAYAKCKQHLKSDTGEKSREDHTRHQWKYTAGWNRYSNYQWILCELYHGLRVRNRKRILANRPVCFSGVRQTSPTCVYVQCQHDVTWGHRRSYSGVKVAAVILECSEDDMLRHPGDQHLRIYDADDSTNWPEWLKQKSIEQSRRNRTEPEIKKVEWKW